MHNYIEKLNLKNNLRKCSSSILASFMLGVAISSIPYVKSSIDNINYERRVIFEKNLEIKEIEEICKGDSSAYSKFYELGFPETALAEFDNCMDRKLEES